jgi:hypothetical protein
LTPWVLILEHRGVQNRYAGDIGDFMKFGLLRFVAQPVADGGTGLRIGLNWYLVPDEDSNKNNDGKYLDYLWPTSRWHLPLKQCAPDLMALLAEVVTTGRSVQALVALGALPAGSLEYRDVLNPVVGRTGRRAWHRQALAALADSQIVFVDPDNGLRSIMPSRRHHKYALIEELADYASRGQALVAYHHADRERDTTAVSQARRRLAELADGAGQAPVGAVIARRYSCRFFLVTAPADRRAVLAASLAGYVSRWAPHAELVS